MSKISMVRYRARTSEALEDNRAVLNDGCSRRDLPADDPGARLMTDTSTEEFDPQQLAEHHVAVWNETDPARRHAMIRELWSADATHVLQAPLEIRRAAERLGFRLTRLQARGHQALDERVARAHEEFVAPGTFTFRSRPNAGRLHDTVKFNWEMVPRDGSAITGVGLEILQLGPDGRIVHDYQFIEG
jgi:hypothetical protein